MFDLFPSVSQPSATERRSVHLAGKEISYILKRSKRRSIGLRIDDDGLTVTLPLRASQKWMHEVLQEKAQWIVAKLEGWQSRKPVPVCWQDGERIPFMGEQLVLRIVHSLFAAPPLLRGRELFVHVSDGTNAAAIEQAVTQWYQREAEVLLKTRVAYFAPQLMVSPSAIKLSSARTQWGSCNARGVLHFNWQLIKLPLRLLDYVVVHELAHLIEMNHSQAFWQVVKSACPDFAKRRAELRCYGLAE